MTLIAAFRCPDSIVLCADAQETVGDYRVAIQKIVPETMKKFQVVIAGSGDAELVRSFVTVLRRHVGKRSFGNLKGFVEVAELALEEFYSHDVKLCPRPDAAPKFIVAARTRSDKYEAWTTQNVRLEPILQWELIGWDEALYKSIAARLYRGDMCESEAIALGLHLMNVARETSNYVGGSTSVSCVSSNGVREEPQDKIRRWELRLAEYEQSRDREFVHSALLEMSGGEFLKS